MAVVPITTGDPADSNIWLVMGDSALLVDTGTGQHDDIVSRAVSNALGKLPLQAVLLTHCHIDHVGGAARIARDFGCPVYIGAKDAPYVRSADPRFTVSRMFGLHLDPLEVGELSEGDVFDVGSHRLRVIDTPGHTPGGISFYDEVTGSLFSGDTLFQYGIGRTDFSGGSLGELIESLLRLRKVNITTLYPGHGATQANGQDSLRYALQMVGCL